MAASTDVANEETASESHIYRPGADFEEVKKLFSFETPLSDSTELWLIQEPMNQLLPDDINGKEISLKLRNEELGKLDLASGKSFEVVTFTSEEPSALLFLPGAHLPEAAVKISRRVCLVHYPDASDLEKSKPHLTSSSHRSGGSQRSSMPSGSSTPSKVRFGDTLTGPSHDTLTSTHTMGQSVESAKHSRRKWVRDKYAAETGRLSGRHSHMSQPESHITSNSFGSPGESPGQSSRKKNKIKQ